MQVSMQQTGEVARRSSGFQDARQAHDVEEPATELRSLLPHSDSDQQTLHSHHMEMNSIASRVTRGFHTLADALLHTLHMVSCRGRPYASNRRHSYSESLDMDSTHRPPAGFSIDAGWKGTGPRTGLNMRSRRAILIGIAVSCLLAAVVAGCWWGLHGTAHRAQHSLAWSFADLDRLMSSQPPDAAQAPMTFYVIGDWGRQGNPNQQMAAELMAQAADRLNPDFIISTGDNFYPSGLCSASDPQFQQSFTSVYSQPSVQGIPWYAVLGNHDYGDGLNKWWRPFGNTGYSSSCISPDWQLRSLNSSSCHDPANKCDMVDGPLDSRWACERRYKLTMAGGKLDMFFIDTNPLVAKYRAAPWADVPGGISSQNASEQQPWLAAQLAASSAPWKLVVGHHPVYSSGEHGDTAELSWLVPLLQQHGVQLYMNGHDHHMEIIKQPDHPTYFATSGAGSNIRAPAKGKNSLHASSFPGFMAVTLSARQATLLVFSSGSNMQPAFMTTVDL